MWMWAIDTEVHVAWKLGQPDPAEPPVQDWGLISHLGCTWWCLPAIPEPRRQVGRSVSCPDQPGLRCETLSPSTSTTGFIYFIYREAVRMWGETKKLEPHALQVWWSCGVFQDLRTAIPTQHSLKLHESFVLVPRQVLVHERLEQSHPQEQVLAGPSLSLGMRFCGIERYTASGQDWDERVRSTGIILIKFQEEPIRKTRKH